MSPAETKRTKGVQVRPHRSSYFLPGKMAGKAVTFLLDSGYTTNLLSRQLFDPSALEIRLDWNHTMGNLARWQTGHVFPSML